MSGSSSSYGSSANVVVGGTSAGDGAYSADNFTNWPGYELGCWGIGLAVVGALFTSTGLCLQKMVQSKLSSSPSSGPVSRNRWYIAGILYVFIGQVMKVFVNVMVPMTVVAPLSAQTIVLSTALEWFFLNGEMSVKTAASMGCIVVGIVVSLIGVNFIDGQYSVQGLQELFLRKEPVIFTAIIVAAMVTGKLMLKHHVTDIATMLYSAFCSAMSAGWFNLAIKSISEIIKYAFLYGIKSSSNVKKPFLWCLIGSIPVLGMIKLRTVTRSLTDYHPLLFLPVYQGFMVGANALCGMLYFDDMNDDRMRGTRASVATYVLGLALVCTGISGLSHRYYSGGAADDKLSAEGEGDTLLGSINDPVDDPSYVSYPDSTSSNMATKTATSASSGKYGSNAFGGNKLAASSTPPRSSKCGLKATDRSDVEKSGPVQFHQPQQADSRSSASLSPFDMFSSMDGSPRFSTRRIIGQTESLYTGGLTLQDPPTNGSMDSDDKL